MKWLIWGPAIALVLSAFAVPGGIALFALPVLALGYLVFALIAPGGSEEHYTAGVPQIVRAERDPASRATQETSSDEKTT